MNSFKVRVRVWRATSPSRQIAELLGRPRCHRSPRARRMKRYKPAHCSTPRSTGRAPSGKARSFARRRTWPAVSVWRSADGRGSPARRKARRMSALYGRRSRSGSTGPSRRRIDRTPPSARGGGSKHRDGIRGPARKDHHGPQASDRTLRGGDAVRFRTTSHCTIRSAPVMEGRGSSSSRRSSAVVIPNGMFPNARNGARGSRTSRASPSKMVTSGRSPNRARRRAASRGSSSTAITRPAREARASVSRPVPAPISSTRSVDEMPARSTSSAARRLDLRKCCPFGRTGERRVERARRASTEDHHVGVHAYHPDPRLNPASLVRRKATVNSTWAFL